MKHWQRKAESDLTASFTIVLLVHLFEFSIEKTIKTQQVFPKRCGISSMINMRRFKITLRNASEREGRNRFIFIINAVNIYRDS